MRRYTGLLIMIAVLIVACGESTTVQPTVVEDQAADSSTEPEAIATATPSVTPTATLTSTPTTGPVQTRVEGDHTIIAIDPIGTPAKGTEQPQEPSTPAATRELEQPTLAPPATVEPLPEPLVEFPAVPEITSCEQAVELTLERYQMFLDVIAEHLDEQPDGEDDFSPQLDATLALLGEQLDDIDYQETSLGCTEERQRWWISRGLERLVADGPAAELWLDLLKDAFRPTTGYVQLPDVTPTWVVATCEDGARIFVERTQIMLNGTATISPEAIERFDSGDGDPPEVLETYFAELIHLIDDLYAADCNSDEMHTLILARIDELHADHEFGQQMIDELREAFEAGDFFYML